MKLTQVLYSGLGGHGAVAFALQEASGDAWRHEMVFLGIEPVLPDYTRRCGERGVGQHYVAATAGKPWQSWAPLYRALGAAAPDAIVLHSVKTILPCWRYARRHRIPLIAVEHQSNPLKSRSEWAASAALMALADAVVVLSGEYRDALLAGLGRWARPGKVHLIPNGIDTAAFAPRAARQPGPRRVGMAARFSGIKRHGLLIEAMAHLRDRDGPDAWRLSLAGDGETRAALADRIAAEGLSEMIELPGFLGGDDLRDWFGGLDIYAHASDGETLSTSILQAMACGLPILGSDVPGITLLLAEGGGCGMVAPAETGAGFAAGLTQLATAPDLAADLGARARARAQAAYSQDAMFAAYRNLLKGV